MQRGILMRLWEAVMAIFVGIPCILLFWAIRRRCPNCQRRGLLLPWTLCPPREALTGDNKRGFYFTSCCYCHYQFWQFEFDETNMVNNIAPTDPHYIRPDEPQPKVA
jgi:hypothetical protein